ALRPGTRYVLKGAFRLEGAQGLEIRRAGQSWRFEGPSEPGSWQSFGREFQTSDQEYWLGRLELRRIGDGTLWIKDLSLTETGGGVELLWEADVNRPRRGIYNPVDCCWLDRIVEAAEQKGIYLMPCLFTRDLYMSDLSKDPSPPYDRAIRDAKHLLRYAAARWGYSAHIAAWEYFNEIDPGLPTDRFYREMAQYLDEVDVHGHLRTTSTWHPSARDLKLECLDIGQLHHYMRLPSENDERDEVAVILEKSRFLRQHGPAKPVLIGEFGLATSKWALSDYMKQDTEGVHFHNCLWASAFAGSSGTALFWWWELLDQQDAYRHYRPLAECLRQVSFAGLQTSTATARPESIRVLGYQGPRQAYLWLADRRASWWNRVVENRPPEEIRQAELKLDGLNPGPYSVQWRDTWDANLRREDTVTATSSGLTLAVPPFRADIACLLQQRL
ncbi:MAG: hypothetical protein JW810_08120, partial [Sedimentisphaerales bacterium]|nr:hypothetical protein [Sedimentisphaerales bacterium]